jgi:hypothetical protein
VNDLMYTLTIIKFGELQRLYRDSNENFIS